MDKMSREFVVKELMTGESIKRIIETADRAGCHGVDLASEFVVASVHYMQVSSESGWELGFVPKKVDYDGYRISSNEVFLYRADSHRLRGPNDCVFANGQWELYPD